MQTRANKRAQTDRQRHQKHQIVFFGPLGTFFCHICRARVYVSHPAKFLGAFSLPIEEDLRRLRRRWAPHYKSKIEGYRNGPVVPVFFIPPVRDHQCTTPRRVRSFSFESFKLCSQSSTQHTYGTCRLQLPDHRTSSCGRVPRYLVQSRQTGTTEGIEWSNTKRYDRPILYVTSHHKQHSGASLFVLLPLAATKLAFGPITNPHGKLVLGVFDYAVDLLCSEW